MQALHLEVGDRLIFVTDGMLERDAAGMNIAAILTEGSDMHPREAVQHLARAVLQASGGELRDDATAVSLDWHGRLPGSATPARKRGPIPAPRAGVRPSRRLRRRRSAGADPGGTLSGGGGALAAGEPAAALGVGRRVVELVVVVEG